MDDDPRPPTRSSPEPGRGGSPTCPFDDLDELLALAGYRVEDTPTRNDVLVRLVELARTDELAARVVLQRVLPGLLAVVRRRRQPGDADGRSRSWSARRGWRSGRAGRIAEPPHVAANIVRDAAYRAFIAPGRRRSATEVSVDPRTLDETPVRRP